MSDGGDVLVVTKEGTTLRGPLVADEDDHIVVQVGARQRVMVLRRQIETYGDADAFDLPMVGNKKVPPGTRTKEGK